jgi:hypothetical protein
MYNRYVSKLSLTRAIMFAEHANDKASRKRKSNSDAAKPIVFSASLLRFRCERQLLGTVRCQDLSVTY